MAGGDCCAAEDCAADDCTLQTVAAELLPHGRKVKVEKEFDDIICKQESREACIVVGYI